MSSVSEVARVQILHADYAAADASDKINALGVGFQLCLQQPNGLTNPSAVAVIIDIPPDQVGEDFALELSLIDDAGHVVQTPGPSGSTPIRFGQSVTVAPPAVRVPGLRIPRGALWSRHQMIVNLQSGVPVAAGRAYEWRVSIDSISPDHWAVRFYVPGPAGDLVVG